VRTPPRTDRQAKRGKKGMDLILKGKSDFSPFTIGRNNSDSLHEGEKTADGKSLTA